MKILSEECLYTGFFWRMTIPAFPSGKFIKKPWTAGLARRKC
jgi:hypothetical protein